MKDTEIGCIRSHKKAIQRAKDKELHDFFLFEDDIDLIDDFDSILALCLSELPKNWDALWLGGSSVKTSYHSAYLKRLEKGTGGYGILIRNTVYNRFISALDKENDLADICYMKLMGELNIYKTFINLVLHKDGYSTIQKKHVSYPDLNGTK